MTTDEVNAYIRKMFQDFGDGNPQTFLDFLDDNVVVEFPLNTGLPWAGTVSGKMNVIETLGRIGELGSYPVFELLDCVSAGDKHFIEMRETFRYHSSGEEVTLHQVFIYETRDCKAVSIRQFCDTAAIRDSFERSQRN